MAVLLRPVRLPDRAQRRGFPGSTPAVEPEMMVPEELEGHVRTEDHYAILLESST